MAKNSLTVFDFNNQSLETVTIDGEYWFNASQWAKALGYANPSEALKYHVSDKYSKTLDLGRPGRKPLFINEPGLYQLIMRSNLPGAEKFQEWVVEEVLPALRKTGSYSIAPQQKQIKPHYVRRVEELMEQLPAVPDGYWCVLHKSVEVLFYVEQCLEMPVNQTDLLDGSIGRKWSDYRKGQEWAGDRVPFEYRFPDGRKVKPWCYGLHELGHFAQWLEKEYRRNHLPKYLKSKYGAIVKV